jgi:hypothetical protein
MSELAANTNARSTVEETVYDHATWNRFVAEYSRAVQRRMFADWAGRFVKAAAGVSLVILALGVALALILKSLPLVTPEVSLKVPGAEGVPVGAVIGPVASQHVEQTQERVADANGVANFVLFTDRPSGRPGYGDVTTGHHYDVLTDVRPAKQWCYLEVDTGDDLSVSIPLIEVTAGQQSRRADQNLGPRGFSAPEIEALVGLCDIL